LCAALALELIDTKPQRGLDAAMDLCHPACSPFGDPVGRCTRRLPQPLGLGGALLHFIAGSPFGTENTHDGRINGTRCGCMGVRWHCAGSEPR